MVLPSRHFAASRRSGLSVNCSLPAQGSVATSFYGGLAGPEYAASNFFLVDLFKSGMVTKIWPRIKQPAPTAARSAPPPSGRAAARRSSSTSCCPDPTLIARHGRRLVCARIASALPPVVFNEQRRSRRLGVLLSDTRLFIGPRYIPDDAGAGSPGRLEDLALTWALTGIRRHVLPRQRR